MAQIDRLLEILISRRGDSLRLVPDQPAVMIRGGESFPVTRGPLTSHQVLSLAHEVAPPGNGDDARAGEFEFRSGARSYLGRLEHDEGQVMLNVVPGGSGNGGSPVVPSPSGGGGDPVAQDAMEQLLRRQSDLRASDLHLRSGEPPLFRVDGEIVPDGSGEAIETGMLERMLRSIMPPRSQEEFANSNDADLAHELAGVARYRVNVFRDRRGIGSVIRAIPSRVVTAEEMGITPEVQRLCGLSKGLVLVTGPTGSGKSTTLCSLIDLVNRERRDHIVTIEDPIEFVHVNKGCLITQREVGVHTSSFKQALRAALREDPDVVLVGELRDLETVSIAIETAETGHLVFGTLHTSTAAGTIDRIIDQFPSDRQSQVRVMLSESLRGVISQTLCRRIGGGRVAAREILLTTPAISNLIREAKTFQIPSVIQTSRKLGMVTLNDSLLELVESGQVEAVEAYARAVDKPTILQSLKARGHDVSFADRKTDPRGSTAGESEHGAPLSGRGRRVSVS